MALSSQLIIVNFRVLLLFRRSNTVSLETNPLFIYHVKKQFVEIILSAWRRNFSLNCENYSLYQRIIISFEKKGIINFIFTVGLASVIWMKKISFFQGTGSRFSACSFIKMLFFCRDMLYRQWKQYIWWCHNVVKESICTPPWQSLVLDQLKYLQIAVNSMEYSGQQ